MIKTFRGLLLDEAVQKIRLSTNDGLTGYRINKFQVICKDPTSNNEAVVKLFSNEPDATATTTINFDDPTLIAVGLWSNNSITHTYPDDMIIVFDHTVINQDIFITHKSSSGQLPVNFYLELEQVKLDLNQATVATLKDMRASE